MRASAANRIQRLDELVDFWRRLPDRPPYVHPQDADVLRHCGIDLSGPRGRTIVTVTDGVVVHVEKRRNGRDGKSGRYVRIEHAGGVFTSYMHLDAIAPGLSIGDKVKAGQFIGRLGKSGIKESEPHLHFNLELDVGKKETKMIDSTPYLKRAKVIEDPAPKREKNKNRS